MSFPLIDVHAHFIPPFYRDALRSAGLEDEAARLEPLDEWTPDTHLSFMKSANIQKSYLSLAPSAGVLLGSRPLFEDGTETDEAAIESLCRRINTFGSQLRAQYPSQLGFFASLLLPSIAATTREIDFCFRDLAVDGFLLAAGGQGISLTSQDMNPVYEKLNSAHARVLLHPTASCAGQHALNMQRLEADGPAHAARLERYAEPTLDFLREAIQALRDLLLHDVPTRFANIRWIVPHCGAVLSAVLERVPGLSAGALSRDSLKEIMSSNFYFDLAGLPVNSQIHHVLRWTNHTRILYGSNVPLTPWQAARTSSLEVREELLKIFGVETGVHEAMCICHGNARLLFE